MEDLKSNDNKLLSICIPSYNMEAYLARCLESLILDNNELMQQLDVIIVNDGSKDKTSEIAHIYANRFPNSFHVIDKANGHYGSCINAALAVAKGKYFRILDADDWFDKENLALYLKKIAEIDVDCVCSNCIDVYENETKNIRLSGYPYEQVIDLNSLSKFEKYIHMHHIAYRTSLLREINYRQTEGICYTDEEFSYYPLIKSKNLYLIDLPLYYYFIGRPDQSVNKEVSRRIKHHYFEVAKRMVATPIDPLKDNAVAKDIRRKKIYHLLGSQILPSYILFRKLTARERKELLDMLHAIKCEDPATYEELMSAKVRGVPVYKVWKIAPALLNKLFYLTFKVVDK